MSECTRSKASVYSSKADVNSSSDATIHCGVAFSKWLANIVSKTTSHSLYYRKVSSSSPKGYLTATDANSNCDATIYCGVAFSKWFANIVSKTTSHSLYSCYDVSCETIFMEYNK